ISRLHYVPGRRGNDHAQRQQGPTSSGRDRGALFVSPAGFGGLDELRHGVGTELAQGLAGRGQTWVSYTPYVAAHFLKRKHIVRDLTRLLQRELQWRGVEARCEVEVLPRGDTGFVEFSCRRHRNRPQPPSATPWNLQLHFDRPIDGPLILGYGSHFGLGIFRHKAR
ncbi:MAG: type I-G CRISPR-associated protein Csb2, partial [Nannocystaceae bacterium]